MDKENMKNMVILKDLPSNIVEEAIVILKPNVKFKSLDIVKTKKEKGKEKEKNKNVNKTDKNSKKYIVNEAQMVISNYLSQIEKQKKKTYNSNKKLESKYKKIKVTAIFLGIALILSFLIR